MFRFAMCWNRSARVSFRNGLELLRPCFISQWAGVAPPMFRFAMGWSRSAHVFVLYFAVAWISELFVFRCGLDFPRYLYAQLGFCLYV